MAEIRILTETDLRQIISLDLESVTCVEDAFRALASGGVSMPPSCASIFRPNAAKSM